MTSIRHTTYSTTTDTLTLTMCDGRVYELDTDDAQLIIDSIDAAETERDQ
ncbi:MAG: hypothetical protein ACTHYO_10400 [Micrococcaceae bacterium]